jgi:hypothetical protein
MRDQEIPIDQQKYLFVNKNLENRNTFSSYQITDNSMIHLRVSLKPTQPE